MEAFVRFQKTGDGIYYSLVEPDYNVLPLISKHFEKRYADQSWLIYDGRRNYGIYYDLQSVATVQLQRSSEGDEHVFDVSEDKYQQLWKQYFRSVNIPARKNMRLHLQHMPRRYWKNLVEKQPG